MGDECPNCKSRFTYRKSGGLILVCRNCGQQTQDGGASSAGSYSYDEPAEVSPGRRMHDIMNGKIF